jgi:hypothetical protein
MITTKYFVAGQEVTPFNHKELSLELNFDKDSTDSRVSINKWRFVNEGADIVYKRYADGLSGGTGIFEGIPFQIVVADGANQFTFEQYLDLTTSDAVISCDNIESESRNRAGVDWLNTIADSFTFEYLNERTTFLPDNKFVAVPYVLNSIPNYKEVMLVSITMAFSAEQLSAQLSDLSGILSALSNPFSAPADFIKAVFKIIYIITLIVTLIKLINDLIDLIIQPVKYHKGMYVRDMIDAACSYLGLTFESTILKQGTFLDTFIIPRKFDNPIDLDNNKTVRQKALGILGFTRANAAQTGYFEGSFGDLLRAMKVAFNGKIILQDNVLRLEREDYNTSTAKYVIPDIYSPAYTTNANELISNYVVDFQTDVNDKNTIQDFRGNIVRAYTSPKTVVNRDMVLTQGFESKSIPFALARRKENLTFPERILKGFLDAITKIINAIIKVVNALTVILRVISRAINSLSKVLKLVGIPLKIKIPLIKTIQPVNFGQIVNDRVGMLSIENDSILVAKIMLLQRGATDRQNKIYANNIAIFNAKYLYDNFHFIQSFVPNSSGVHNQWLRKSITNVPFCFEDYQLLQDNNEVFTIDGKKARIESLRWNVWKQTAEIDYRYNELYTNNLKVELHEAQGY